MNKVLLTDEQMRAAKAITNGSGTYRAFGNVLPGRDLNSLLGSSRLLSTKHDFTFDFGYKDDVDFFDLYAIYKRNGVANAVVNKTAGKTWETMPTLQEGKEEHDETGLEAEIRKNFSHNRFWQQLKECDKRSLVGEYSGVIFRFADGKDFDQPVEGGLNGIDGLVGIIPAWEGQLQISQWDQNRQSPTFGEPVMMTFTESSVDSDQGKTKAFYVHPDRVYIWSQDRTTFNDSDLEPVYNSLVDMVKIRGAGAEGFWKNSKSQPVLQADADVNFQQLAQMLGTDLAGLPEALDNVVADWNKGFDQSLILQGMEAKTLGITLPQPEQFYTIAAREVAAAWNMPEKILFGNQTGERASTEDAASWNRHNMGRREAQVKPNIMDIIQRLVKFRILPERDYHIKWDDLTEASMEEKIDRALKMAEVNAKMAATGSTVFSDDEIRDAVGLPPIEESDLSEFGDGDDEDDDEQDQR